MLAEKRAELARLQVQIETLESALRRASGEPETPAKTRTRRSNVKGFLIDLLRQANAGGLNAASAVEMAAKLGEHLERGTASSLLSRFKSEGIVTYDGNVYRLKQSAPAAETDETSVVH
jgi:hypothetical protein